jgi:hypothetical protein
MSNEMLFDLLALITYAVFLTIVLTYALFVLLLKEVMEQQQALMADFMGSDEETSGDQHIDNFASTPVGIPPSLNRD